MSTLADTQPFLHNRRRSRPLTIKRKLAVSILDYRILPITRKRTLGEIKSSSLVSESRFPTNPTRKLALTTNQTTKIEDLMR